MLTYVFKSVGKYALNYGVSVDVRFFMDIFFEIKFQSTKEAYTNIVHEKELQNLSNLSSLLVSFINFEYSFTRILVYLYTPLILADFCLHPSHFTSSEMLLNLIKIDETDRSLYAFEYGKINKGI